MNEFREMYKWKIEYRLDLSVENLREFFYSRDGKEEYWPFFLQTHDFYSNN